MAGRAALTPQLRERGVLEQRGSKVGFAGVYSALGVCDLLFVQGQLLHRFPLNRRAGRCWSCADAEDEEPRQTQAPEDA